MFDQSKGNLRPVGVRLAENQSTEQAPTMTIVGISDLEFKLMEWGDESGRKHRSLVLVAFTTEGEPEVWLPPGPESWITSCKAFAKPIQEQFRARYKAHLEKLIQPQDKPVSKVQVPEKDEVDVVDGGAL